MRVEQAGCGNDVVVNMRSRLQRCRRLAVATHDIRAGDALRAMADEIEADIERLEAETGSLAESTLLTQRRSRR